MKLSAVIPTKNRADELQVAAASILAQRRRPDELLVIDQSATEDGKRRLEALMAAQGAGIALHYVYDPSIRGLVHAKQVAAGIAQGDIVCFLEDDEVLEPGYFAEIERGFLEHPEMMGCCGLVTNLPPQPSGYVALFHLFHRGMFRDPRVGVHGHVQGSGLPLIPSDYLSGGLSCWRREVLQRIPFDVDNGFHLLEDVDYSTRAVRAFGHRFFINPNARLEHRLSPVNREVLGPRQQRKLREYLMFYKKRRTEPWAAAQLAWLLVGLLLEALAQCASARRPAPLLGYAAGLRDGVAWTLRGNAN